MRVLVTGGTGLIGRHVIGELLTRGVDVVSFDASSMSNAPRGAVSIIGDIRDAELLCREIQERGVDRVIHCAAMLQATCEDNPALAVAINASGTVNVLEAAQSAGVRRVVLASSVAVYGRTRYSPMDETHPCEPAGIYATTKLLGEHLARAYERAGGTEVFAVRFGLVYGPGGVRSKGVAAEFRNMLRGVVLERRVKIPSSEQMVPLTYVSDAARGAVLACLKTPPPAHRIYNVSGHGHRLTEVAELLCRLYPGTTIAREENALASPLNGDLDIALARTELEYAPTIGFEEGIRRTCAYLESTANLANGPGNLQIS